MVQRLSSSRQMLEAVPEDDPRPTPIHFSDVELSHLGVRGSSLESEDVSAASAKRIEQRSISRTDVEDSAGWRDAVEPAREAPARGPE